MFKISLVKCAAFHRDSIQSRLRLFSSITEPLAADHTVACGGSMSFVCLKIHFIDIVGEFLCHWSIGPNSFLLILFVSNLLQKNWKTKECCSETNTSAVSFSFSRENKQEEGKELIPSPECSFQFPPQVAQFGPSTTKR